VSAAAGTAEGGHSGHNPWVVAIVVTGAAFMELLDTTIVNVSLPHIAGSLSSGQDESTWTLTSYLVANGIVVPISGWLSSVFGRKRFFLTCILAFTAASVLCGLAQSLPQLVVCRVLQGLFGGGLQPSQQAILLDTFRPAERGKAFSMTAIATVMAPVIGPTLGGWLTDNYSWRWIFFINLPVGILAWFFTMQVVEDPPTARADPGKARHIDYPGLGLIALGLGCLQVMLDRGEDDDWFGSNFIRVFAMLAFVGIVGSILWLSVAKNPVVDLRLFRNSNFSIGCAVMFVFAGILYGGAVLLPQFGQQELGYTATWAGLLLSPGALVAVAMFPVVGRLMNVMPAHYLVMAGFAVIGISLLLMSRINPQISFNWLVLLRACQTLGISLLFAPIATVTTATLRPDQSNAGGALFSMSRNVGGSVGISIATALVTERTQAHSAYLVDHLSALDARYNQLIRMTQQALLGLGRGLMQAQGEAPGTVYQTLRNQAAVMGYLDVFIYYGWAALVVVPFCLLMKRGGGKPGAGH